MIPSSDRGHLATSILAVHGGRSPAQAGSRYLEDLKEGVRWTLVRSEPRRMNRPQVAYFLSGALAYFPPSPRQDVPYGASDSSVSGPCAPICVSTHACPSSLQEPCSASDRRVLAVAGKRIRNQCSRKPRPTVARSAARRKEVSSVVCAARAHEISQRGAMIVDPERPPTEITIERRWVCLHMTFGEPPEFSLDTGGVE